MVYGIYQSAAGMQVNQYRQELLANNLANVSTAGFKPDLAVVRERQVAAREDLVDPALNHPVLNRLTGGSLVAPTYTSFQAGPLEQTGNPLDAALAEDGFFVVRDGDRERYTRDGRFTLNAQGELVTVAGNHPVLNEQGQPLKVPPNAAGQARMGTNGELRAGGAGFGKIAVVDFADKQQLRKTGGNLFDATGTQPKEVDPQLVVGSIENSAVDPTQAMVSMIEVSRAYQLNATLVGLADSTLGRAVNDIARLR